MKNITLNETEYQDIKQTLGEELVRLHNLAFADDVTPKFKDFALDKIDRLEKVYNKIE